MSDDQARDFLEGIKAQSRAGQELIDKYVPRYEAGDRDFFKGRERAVWRCKQRGCLLLLVWDAPEGTLWLRPAYKLSPGLNIESSNAEGREKNTLDGDRHWKANLATFDQVRMFDPAGNISLECRHTHYRVGRDAMVAAVDASTVGKPTKLAP